MTDRELLRVAKSFRSGVLGNRSPKNMCFAVCAPLQSFLSISGVIFELVEIEIEINGEDFQHYILLLPDGRILDPTASQFKTPNGEKMPDIYLGDYPCWYKKINETIWLTN